MTQPIDITNSSRIPEFIARIPNNSYINGILNYEFIDKNRGRLFDAIILVNIEGINKFCITPEFGASKVRHLLIKDFFLKIFLFLKYFLKYSAKLKTNSKNTWIAKDLQKE
jgi:hypothetical protein